MLISKYNSIADFYVPFTGPFILCIRYQVLQTIFRFYYIFMNWCTHCTQVLECRDAPKTHSGRVARRYRYRCVTMSVDVLVKPNTWRFADRSKGNQTFRRTWKSIAERWTLHEQRLYALRDVANKGTFFNYDHDIVYSSRFPHTAYKYKRCCTFIF